MTEHEVASELSPVEAVLDEFGWNDIAIGGMTAVKGLAGEIVKLRAAALLRSPKEHDAIVWVRRLKSEPLVFCPEIVAEEDDCIALDWGGGSRVLSLSFANDGTCCYAGLWDGEVVKGQTPIAEAWTTLLPWMCRDFEGLRSPQTAQSGEQACGCMYVNPWRCSDARNATPPVRCMCVCHYPLAAHDSVPPKQEKAQAGELRERIEREFWEASGGSDPDDPRHLEAADRIIALLTAGVPPQAVPEDTKRLDWLEKRSVESGWCDDYDGDDRRGLWEIRGNRNDREWVLVGAGTTLRAAIDAAVEASPASHEAT